jgi:acetyl-CoA carboxylase carboxyltransferase component
MEPWADSLAEIARRRAAALGLGGSERVALQHSRGKLTARERIAGLLDEGSQLDEIGVMARARSERESMQGRDTPADGVITGLGRVGGSDVLVCAEDFTVIGGSVGHVGMHKRRRLIELAERLRVPVVWLFDGSGARAHEWMRAGWAGGPHFTAMARLSGVVPMVAGIMGPCAGDPALMAVLCDFVVMVRGTSMLAVAGPKLVRAAVGAEVDQQSLGGVDVHVRQSGVADNAADDDMACLRLLREYLSYFPPNSGHRPPRRAPRPEPPELAAQLHTLVPREERRRYDMSRVVRALADEGSLLEVKPAYARSLITALGRMNGDCVGIVANQPLHMAGALDARAADKLTHFVQLCDAFHLPLIFLTDVPGLMVGTQAEVAGTLRRGMRVAHAFAFATTPMVSVIVRKAYGMGAVAMCGQGAGQILTLCWPSGDFAAMPLAGGIEAAHASELAVSGPRPEIESMYSGGDPLSAAADFNFDDLIDPRETRSRIIRWLGVALAGHNDVGTVPRHGIMP